MDLTHLGRIGNIAIQEGRFEVVHHEHHSVLVVVFVLEGARHVKDARVDQLRLLPLHTLLHPLPAVHPRPVTAALHPLLQLRLHAADLLRLIQLLPLRLLFKCVVLPLIPLLLVVLLSLLPPPCRVLVIQISIPDVLDLGNGPLKLGPGKYLAGLVLHFLCLLDDSVAAEDHGA